MAKKKSNPLEEQQPGKSLTSLLGLGLADGDFKTMLAADFAFFIIVCLASRVINQVAAEQGKTQKEVATVFADSWRQAVMAKFQAVLNDYSNLKTEDPMVRFLAKMNVLDDEEAIRIRFTKSVREIADAAVSLFAIQEEPNSQSNP